MDLEASNLVVSEISSGKAVRRFWSAWLVLLLAMLAVLIVIVLIAAIVADPGRISPPG
jgi:hypothetical protein